MLIALRHLLCVRYSVILCYSTCSRYMYVYSVLTCGIHMYEYIYSSWYKTLLLCIRVHVY